MANNMSVFTTKLANTRDLAKSYLFQVIIEPEEGSAVSQIMDSESLTLKARSATLPNKSFGELTTEYLGTKLVFPGKATIDGEFTVKFDEFQDMEITKTFHVWQQLLFNHGFRDDMGRAGITGGASSNKMSDYTSKIKVRLWDSTLGQVLPIEYRFYFCFPKELQAAELDAEGDSKIQRSVTFRYSSFECVNTGVV